jgi:hypothetical protein
MTKRELEIELKELKRTVSNLKPFNHHTYYCCNCGNPFIINQAQFDRRTDKSRVFYCSAGHGNVFNKNG